MGRKTDASPRCSSSAPPPPRLDRWTTSVPLDRWTRTSCCRPADVALLETVSRSKSSMEPEEGTTDGTWTAMDFDRPSRGPSTSSTTARSEAPREDLSREDLSREDLSPVRFALDVRIPFDGRTALPPAVGTPGSRPGNRQSEPTPEPTPELTRGNRQSEPTPEPISPRPLLSFDGSSPHGSPPCRGDALEAAAAAEPTTAAAAEPTLPPPYGPPAAEPTEYVGPLDALLTINGVVSASSTSDTRLAAEPADPAGNRFPGIRTSASHYRPSINPQTLPKSLSKPLIKTRLMCM